MSSEQEEGSSSIPPSTPSVPTETTTDDSSPPELPPEPSSSSLPSNDVTSIDTSDEKQQSTTTTTTTETPSSQQPTSTLDNETTAEELLGQLSPPPKITPARLGPDGNPLPPIQGFSSDTTTNSNVDSSTATATTTSTDDNATTTDAPPPPPPSRPSTFVYSTGEKVVFGAERRPTIVPDIPPDDLDLEALDEPGSGVGSALKPSKLVKSLSSGSLGSTGVVSRRGLGRSTSVSRVRKRLQSAIDNPDTNPIRFTAIKEGSLTEDSSSAPVDQSGGLKRAFYPGDSRDRKLYQTLRYVPIVTVAAWLLIPLGKFWESGAASECQDPYLFLFSRLIYSGVAITLGWYLYYFILPRPTLMRRIIISLLLMAVDAVLVWVFIQYDTKTLAGDETLVGRTFARVLFPAALTPSFVLFVLYMRISHVPATRSALKAEGDTEGADEVVKKFNALTPCVVLFFTTYLFCQAFSSVYFEELSSVPDGQSVPENVYLTYSIFFNVVLVMAKGLMRGLAGRVDALNDAVAVRPVMTFTMDLFFFSFYRSLYSQTDDVIAFVILAAVQLGFEFLLYPLRLTNRYWAVSTSVVGCLRSTPCIPANTNPKLQKQWSVELIVDYFFRVIAEFITLLTFVGYPLLLKYTGYNTEFYRFSDISDDRVIQLLWFFGIMVVFEIISVVSIRYACTKQLNMSAFSIGAIVIQSGALRYAVILVSIHVLQDVYFAFNTYQFCSPELSLFSWPV